MKVYLCGPMSSLPAMNMPAFDAAAEVLRLHKQEVISPAELDSPEHRNAAMASRDGDIESCHSVAGETWGDLLARDVKIISDSDLDAVVVLPGWETSRGARLETYVASALHGLPVFDYQAWREGTGLLSQHEITDTRLREAWAPLTAREAACPPLPPTGEERVVASAGGEKGSKPQRMDLIPYGAVLRVSEVYGFGARKYTRRATQFDVMRAVERACTCGSPNVIQTGNTTPEGSAGPATKSGSRLGIPSTPRDSAPTCAGGTESTPSASANCDANPRLATQGERVLTSARWHCGASDSTSLMRCDCWPSRGALARSAGKRCPEPATSTTTTRPSGHGDSSAQGATTDWATSGTISMALSEHSPTCGTRRLRFSTGTSPDEVLITGEHNWRRGYEWGLSFAALQRHLAAWWEGEDTDPESGLSHLAHAGFHVLTLISFESLPHYAELDDRPKEAP